MNYDITWQIRGERSFCSSRHPSYLSVYSSSKRQGRAKKEFFSSNFKIVWHFLLLLGLFKKKSWPCDEVGLFEISQICAEWSARDACRLEMCPSLVSMVQVQLSLALLVYVKRFSRAQGTGVGFCGRAQFLSTNCADQKHDGKRLADDTA